MIAGRSSSVAGALLVLALSGCGGRRAAGPSTERAEQMSVVPRTRDSARIVDEAALPDPGRVALRYALAARSWTPSSYQAKHRRQVQLSSGDLRRSLEDIAPTRAQIAGYRADRARLDARVLAVTGEHRSSTQATYTITLDERSIAVGRTERQRATYLVELRHDSGRWLVATFTAQS